jgi:hypothetical protein
MPDRPYRHPQSKPGPLPAPKLIHDASRSLSPNPRLAGYLEERRPHVEAAPAPTLRSSPSGRRGDDTPLNAEALLHFGVGRSGGGKQPPCATLLTEWAADGAATDEEVISGPDPAAATGMTLDGHPVEATDTVVTARRGSKRHMSESPRRRCYGAAPCLGLHRPRLGRESRVVGQWGQPDLWGSYRQLTGPSRWYANPGRAIRAIAVPYSCP